MKREFVINKLGKDYVLYAGLLDEAHSQGLSRIETRLIQAPHPSSPVAIVLAEVTTDKGVFTGLGDASPDNVSRSMVNALIRLAETRAKARALRDAVNVSMLSLEEMDESGHAGESGETGAISVPAGAIVGESIDSPSPAPTDADQARQAQADALAHRLVAAGHAIPHRPTGARGLKAWSAAIREMANKHLPRAAGGGAARGARSARPN